MTKESLCGKDYKGCVDVNGLRKDKLLPAGIECYAPFKACMQTTSKTLNAKNMSPQLQEIVKGLEQDPNKVSAMAIDSIGESLGDTFDKLMEKECKNVGGFYTNGICGMGFVSTKDKSWATSYSATAVSSRTYSNKSGYYTEQSVSSSSGSNSGSERSTKYGIVLPGVQIKCESSSAKSQDNNSSYSSGNNYFSSSNTNNSNFDSNARTSSGVTATCSVGNDSVSKAASASGSASSDFGDPSSASSSASASCTMSEEILLLAQNGDSVEVKPKEQSCGFMFAPKGPWNEFTSQCVGSDKFIYPKNGKDALSIAIEKFKEPEKQGSHIDYRFKHEGLRKYRLTVVSGPQVAIRHYVEAYTEDQSQNKRKIPKNPRSVEKEFSIKEKENEDWKLESEFIRDSNSICKPKNWITGKEFFEIEKRWKAQFIK